MNTNGSEQTNLTNIPAHDVGPVFQPWLNNSIPAGNHEVESYAQDLSSGIYTYRIEVADPVGRTGEFQDVKKMILLR